MISGQDHPELRPPGRSERTAKKPAHPSGKRYLLWGLTSLLLVLALLVLVVLPGKIKERNQQLKISLSETEITSPPARISVQDVAGVAQNDAGLALQSFLRLRAQPDLQGAEIWAPEIWTTAIASAQQGDEHYGRRRFKDAQSAYEAASLQLTALQKDRPHILAESLALGERLLGENKTSPAIEAFERVLAMQGDHQPAQAGLEQARVREQVLKLMIEARQAESANKLDLAADIYSSIVQLDMNYVAAQTALVKVTEILDGQAYQAAMSQALNYLESGNLNAAGIALNTAAGIEPDTPALRDARKRLQEVRQELKLSQLRSDAQKSAADENWQDAISLYQQALGIDGEASFAQTGLVHAKTRLQLNAQFNHYLEAPERLSADEPLENARTLLEANPGVSKNEPGLSAKVAALKEAIRLVSTPVTLLIESDSQTEVTIYHVGRLGTFAQKKISLRPGRYTVTGSRPGYRDVRKIITLSPQKSATVNVRCEEKI
jgi:hypothetical protein